MPDMLAVASSAFDEAASARALLNGATRDVHERMHHHPGFAAVADGSITRDRYRSLLARSYGFHDTFERRANVTPVRSGRLRDDLRVLGLSDAEIDELPRCNLPSLCGAAVCLGARYVVEGSAIGGLVLARGLDELLGRGKVSGRTFLLGDGMQAGKAWASFLGELDRGLNTVIARRDAKASAQATFRAFEILMRGWNDDGSTEGVEPREQGRSYQLRS